MIWHSLVKTVLNVIQDCWSACPKYQAEKEKSQAVLDARKKYYGEVNDFIVDIARAKKRMRKRK